MNTNRSHGASLFPEWVAHQYVRSNLFRRHRVRALVSFSADRKMQSEKGEQKGFTLVEVLVVIALIGIVLAIAVPQYNQINRKNDIERQTRTMLNDLMMARANSIFKHREARIKLTASTFKQYSTLSDSGTPVLSRKLKYPIVFSGSGTIDFDSQGFFDLVSNGNATICIDPPGEVASVDSLVVFSTRMRIGKRKVGVDCANDSDQIVLE